MSWKVYSLGYVGLNAAVSSAAEIISEQLGSCVANTSAQTFTYTYGGETYTVTFSNPYPDRSYEYVLCLNDGTGEFVISLATNDYAQSTAYYMLTTAILRVNMGNGTTALAPINKALAKGYNLTINVYGVGTSNMNTTRHIALVPAVTLTQYTTDTNYQFRPIEDMFVASVSGVMSGQTIEVNGQQFLCVSMYMFAKL